MTDIAALKSELAAKGVREELVCNGAWWDVSGLGGPQIDYPMLPVFFEIRHEEDAQNLEKRYRATEGQLEQYAVLLRAIGDDDAADRMESR